MLTVRSYRLWLCRYRQKMIPRTSSRLSRVSSGRGGESMNRYKRDVYCVLSLVPKAEGESSGWHIFNDFLVRPVTEDEALSFAGTWKVNYCALLEVCSIQASKQLYRTICRFLPFSTISGQTPMIS